VASKHFAAAMASRPCAEWAIARGGHAYMWEHPAAFNQAILAFPGKHRKSSKWLHSKANAHLLAGIFDAFPGRAGP